MHIVANILLVLCVLLAAATVVVGAVLLWNDYERK